MITGGILGIVALRLVVGQLIVLVERYPALVDGAFIIIAWIGAKLCARLAARGRLRRASRSRSGRRWSLVVVIFVMALIYARMQGPVEPGEVDTAEGAGGGSASQEEAFLGRGRRRAVAADLGPIAIAGPPA